MLKRATQFQSTAKQNTGNRSMKKSENPPNEIDDDGLVSINVGGMMFLTKLTTLKSHPETLLGSLTTSSKYYNHEKKFFFFDRNPEHFNTILDYYRNNKIHFPTQICGWMWRQELTFWGIPETDIAECCFSTYFRYENDKKVVEYISKDSYCNKENMAEKNGSMMSLYRDRLWMFLEDPTSSKAARIFSFLYLAFVLLSCIVPMLVTYPDLRESAIDINMLLYAAKLKGLNIWINKENPKEVMFVTTLMPQWLENLDLFINVFFTLDLILRFMFCPNKLKFFKQFLNIVDIVLLLAMWTRYGISHYREEVLVNLYLMIIYSTCYSLSVFRLLRFFRITKQYSSLRILILSVRASVKELGLLLITFSIVVIFFSNIIYFAEMREPTTFPDMVIGLWWTVVTMTTLGYGDIYPKSALGRIVGSCCAMSGLLLFAMPIAIIAGKFSHLYTTNADLEEFKKLSKEKKNEHFTKVHPFELIHNGKDKTVATVYPYHDY